MKFGNYIKVKVRKYLDKRRGKFSVTGFGIAHDWFVLVLIFSVSLVWVFVNGLEKFNQIISGEIFETNQQLQEFSDNKELERIDEVLNKFTEREKVFRGMYSGVSVEKEDELSEETIDLEE